MYAPRPFIGWSRLVFGICHALLTISFAVCAIADDEPDPASGPGDPRHRLDFGVQWFDAAEGDSFTGSLNYSWVPLDHHGFGVSVPLIGAEFGETEGSGIGDTQIQYSYVPSAKLTASSWLPKTLGTGLGLILPTGDPAKGTGADRWVVIPTLGWVFPINERFTILPTLQYLLSFGEDSADDEVSAANLQLGFLYVSKSEFWVNYTASLYRDFKPVDDTNLDHLLTAGKQFTRVLAGSLTLGSIERPPLQDAAVARDSDQFVQFTLHFVLSRDRG